MRNVNTGHLTNCCVITNGKREEQDRGGGREQGPSVCGVGKPEQSWAVYGRGVLQEMWRLSTVEFKERLAGKQATGGRTAPLPKQGEIVR